MSRSTPRHRSRSETGPLPDFGTFTAERRRALKLTQRDLADLADVGISSVRTLEAGHTSQTMAVTLRILDALGLTLVAMPLVDARDLTAATELRVVEAHPQ
ncbi:helix-turn-helix domain-containing protein [Nocardia jiangxiensis]|uniref:Helix-turn-helix domain-containing protein n=1 Tax=Nocardia jiangxiensis TaxID=282685 RepID=A0ABW6SD42_9NOCA|nr:helix-turn-helix domain-containing protein [Nocardia jiangxiensis]